MATDALSRPVPPEPQTPPLAGLRVLVVDDNPPIRQIVISALGRAGADARGAGDA